MRCPKRHRRCAGGSAEHGGPQRPAPAAPGRLAARFLPHRGRPRQREVVVHRCRRADRRTSRPLSPSSASGGARSRRGLLPGAGRRRPGHVGDDHPQPAVERGQIHAAGLDYGRGDVPNPRYCVDRDPRHRGRDCRRGPGPPVRPLLPGRKPSRPQCGGHRNRALAGARAWSSCTAERVEIDSESDSGTTVTIRLPQSVAMAADQSPAGPAGQTTRTWRRPVNGWTPLRSAGRRTAAASRDGRASWC